MRALFHRNVLLGLAAGALLAAGMPTVAHADVAGFPVMVRLPDGRSAAHVDVIVRALRSITEGEGDIPIAEGVTDVNGVFNVVIPVTEELLAEANYHAGFLNVETTAFLADTVARAQGTAGNAVAEVDSLLENPPGGVEANLTGLLTAVRTDPIPFGVDGLVEPPDADPNTVDLLLADTIGDPTEDPTTAPDDLNACWPGKWGKIQGPTAGETIIGELHTYQDMTARFVYNQNANTDIGVGYSADGKNWKVSGSAHMGNETSIEHSGVAAPAYWGHQIVAHFNYVKERRYWYCDFWRVATEYRTRATMWNGDEYPGNDVSGGDGYYTYKDARDEGCSRCAKFIPKQSFVRNAKKTKKYGTAVTIFGVGLTSQTGYDTTHKLSYKFGSQVGEHWLIGNDNPPTAAGVIYAY